MIRVLLVDDQVSVREGLRMRLALEADVAVVGEAGTGVEALQIAQSLEPDVVIMDVEMPEMDGITATRLLRALLPHVSVVMHSIHHSAETRARALEAGVFDFVQKQGEIAPLLCAVRSAALREGKV